MIFLSNSIATSTNDIIGFETYVNKLNEAINSGAQMIAITSPFGSGKTSVVELLKNSRSERENEQFLHIQMWSELNGGHGETNSHILHKNFLYQLGSAISPRKGTYINRRLSNNYGLLKLHVNNWNYWCVVCVSIVCAILGVVFNKYSDLIVKLFPKLRNYTNMYSAVLFLVALVLLVFVICCAEILFSSKNSERQRIIEADEMIDLYRREIINKKGKSLSCVLKLLQKIKGVRNLAFVKEMTYIAIIEDLDRTNDGTAVVHFLKELRKYYFPMNDNGNTHHNKIVFIVNIKQESNVMEDACRYIEESKLKTEENVPKEDANALNAHWDLEKEGLYVKIFDYILNLQTINIVDYDIILCALLEENKEYLEKHKLIGTSEKLSDIPGMQWIIGRRNLDIRQIKRRLNVATTIFETLKERFPDKEDCISFEKCAVAAYLTTSYELEFGETEDTAFECLIEQKIQKKLNEDNVKKELGTSNDDYVRDVYELIDSKLLDSNYRMYFYNYPKNSVVYGMDEMNIQNAILYGVECRHIELTAKRVVDKKSDIIQKSLKKLRDLNLSLPQIVIDSENLFLETIKYDYKAVLEMFQKMDTKDVSLDKNIIKIIEILKYDLKRRVYSPQIFSDFCNVWEKVFDESHLVKIRESISKNFKKEILFFQKLYFGKHTVIGTKEMDGLNLLDAMKLLNIESNNFSVSHVKYIIGRLEKEPQISIEISERVCNLLLFACEVFNVVDIAECLLEYMLLINKIVPQLEEAVWKLLIGESTDLLADKEQEEIFIKYNRLINSVQIESVTGEILEHINGLEGFEKEYAYSLDIANKLYQNRYYLMYMLVCLNNDKEVDFSDKNIINCVIEERDWLQENKEAFRSIRKSILANADNIQEFGICFESEFPPLSNEEFILLTNNKSIDVTNVLNLFSKETIDEEVVEYLTKYFNRRHVSNNIAYEILVSIDKYSAKIVKLFFAKIDFFSAFIYAQFSREKKNNIKKIFAEKLELDTYKGKLDFMECTRFLDEKYEIELLDHMDDTMINKYVNLVRRSKGPRPINLSTIELLKSFSSYYSFSPSSGVNKKMLEEKEYEYYVVSTTLHAKKFHMVQGEMLEELWPTYIDLYSYTSSMSKTRAYMQANKEFLIKIMKNEDYIGFPNNVLETLSVIPQDYLLVAHIFEKGASFAIKYFSCIKEGFVDDKAENVYLDLLAQDSNRTVLISNAVHENVYEQLNNSNLKRKYTNLRKASGFKK